MSQVGRASRACAFLLAVVLTAACPFSSSAKTSTAEFELCGPHMTKRPKITWDFRAPGESSDDDWKTIKKWVKAAVDLALGTVDVPPTFRVHDMNVEDSNGPECDVWNNEIYLPLLHMIDTLEIVHVDSTSAAHETGHLIFQAMLKHFAPDVYEAYARSNANRGGRAYKYMDPIISSYAELFSDLVSLLVTGDVRAMGDNETGNEKYQYRIWGDGTPMPWELGKGDNYAAKDRDLVYKRLTWTRQFLWLKYRKYLQGSEKKRRQILAAVGESMIAEIAEHLDDNMSDRERNQSLIARIQAAMD